MKIVIAGGTGSIGSKLVEILKDHHELIILSRSKNKIISKNLRIVNYSRNNNDWYSYLNKSDVIINLVGESINNRRWTKKQKKIILNSRLDSVTRISQALSSINYKPKLIMNASAVGYYSYSDKRQDESDTHGNHFLSEVCLKWENKVTKEFFSKSDRLAILRIGVVLDSNSGILSKLSFLFKCGVGAIIGNGRQKLSWIDIDDVSRAIDYIINSDMKGAINLVSPISETNYSFSKKLGKVFKKPVFLKIPKIFIRLLLGEMSQIVINGSNIYPKALLKSGYQFQFPKLIDSLKKNYSNIS